MRLSSSSSLLVGRGLLAAFSALIWAGACGFPDQSFIPDGEFYGGSAGAAGDGGQGGLAGSGGDGGSQAGVAGKSGAGQSGTSGQSGAGNGGAGNGGAGNGGAGEGGAGNGGAGNGGAGNGGAGEGGAGNGGAGESGAGGAGEGGAGNGGAGEGGAGEGGAGNGGASGAGTAGAAGAGAGGALNCHSPCEKGLKLDPACSPCAATVCSQTPDCCNNDWSSFCVLSAKSLCGPNCDGGGGAAGSSGAGAGGTSGASGQSGAGAGGEAGAAGAAGEAGAAGTGGDAGAAGTGGAGAGGAGAGGAGAGGAGAAGAAGCGGGTGGLCDHTADCVCGQVCSKFNLSTGDITCQAPKASGFAIGDSCTANGFCLSNACDSFTKTCSVGCKGSLDCGAGNVCGRTFFSQTAFFDQCFKACGRDSDCPANAGGSQVCFLKDDIEIDIPVWACAYLGREIGEALPGGGIWRGFGETMAAGDSCYSGLGLSTNLCSKACVADSDCAAPLPKCGNVNVPNPSGSGNTILKGCVPLPQPRSPRPSSFGAKSLTGHRASLEKPRMGHAHHDDHDHDAHDAHDDHHEPPPPEEPHSPWWLTLVGAILFVSGGIFFLVANADPAPTPAKGEQKAEGQAAPPPRPALNTVPVLPRPGNPGH